MVAGTVPPVVGPAAAFSATGIHVQGGPPYTPGSSAKSGPQADDKTAAVVDHPRMSTRTADATTAVLAAGLMGLVAAIVQIRCGRSLGSGVVFDTHGDVVTNAHVLDGASSCTVTLSGGAKQSADVVGRATANHVAVVRLRSATPSPATFADSKKVQVGDFVLAMGNPLGLRLSVTQGIVSSLNRNVAESSSVELSALIQTSAEITPETRAERS